MTHGRPKTILGLTGSIGMGKSTTADFFRQAGVPVYDSDAAVHRLYDVNGGAVKFVIELFPNTIRSDGAIDREQLRKEAYSNKNALEKLESIVHPLVDKEIRSFIDQHSNSSLILLDIPLLFETKAEALCDAVLVVTAPADVQRDRVLARVGMTEIALEAILAKQMPDLEKRARADFVIDTSLGLQRARAEVRALIANLADLR